MLRSALRGAAVLLLSISAALADPSTAFPEKLWDPDLLRLLSVGPSWLDDDMEIGLPEPPPPGSPALDREIARLHALAPLRTAGTITLIHRENDPAMTAPDAFRGAGLLPPPDEAPAAWALARRSVAEVRWFILREKWRFRYPRPSHVDPTLGTVIPVPPHAAYPSGHSGEAHAVALVLSLVDPDCAEAYLTHALEVAVRREVAGVHYHMDTLAGIHVARTVVSEMLRRGHFGDLPEKAASDLSERAETGFSCHRDSLPAGR